jgi:hypothetical protein
MLLINKIYEDVFEKMNTCGTAWHDSESVDVIGMIIDNELFETL